MNINDFKWDDNLVNAYMKVKDEMSVIDFKLKNISPNKNWEILAISNNQFIISIKRKKDNAIISVRDTIFLGEPLTEIIDEIKFNSFNQVIIRCGEKEYNGDDFNVIDLRKEVFISDDNQKVYKGDFYLFVTNQFIVDRAECENLAPSSFVKTFKDKKKLDEFILGNKPVVCYNDIITISDEIFNKYCNKEFILIKKSDLKALVNEKINKYLINQ